jgi:hypothetical protein
MSPDRLVTPKSRIAPGVAAAAVGERPSSAWMPAPPLTLISANRWTDPSSRACSRMARPRDNPPHHVSRPPRGQAGPPMRSRLTTCEGEMSLKQPHCPTCKSEMTLAAVELFGGSRPHYERRRYECSACNLRETHVGEHAGHGALAPSRR